MLISWRFPSVLTRVGSDIYGVCLLAFECSAERATRGRVVERLSTFCALPVAISLATPFVLQSLAPTC